jgi:hypothetical protein
MRIHELEENPKAPGKSLVRDLKLTQDMQHHLDLYFENQEVRHHCCFSLELNPRWAANHRALVCPPLSVPTVDTPIAPNDMAERRSQRTKGCVTTGTTIGGMQVADKEVLAAFPAAIQRRVLRALYLEKLSHVYLLRAPYFADKPEFMVTLLERGEVELFMANVVVVPKDRRVNDLLVLLNGELEVIHDSWERQRQATLQREALSHGDSTWWHNPSGRLFNLAAGKIGAHAHGHGHGVTRRGNTDEESKAAMEAVVNLNWHERGSVAVAMAQVDSGIAPPAVRGGSPQYYVNDAFSIILGPGTCIGELAFFTRTKSLVVRACLDCANCPSDSFA